ncbi:MAG: hypothetical protein ACKO1V_02275 [Cyanobium sp.]
MDPIQAVRQQLSAFDAELQSSNPVLYRDLALYLQVLRDGLLNAVQQACFHLATRFYPERYCGLSPEQRAGLHTRIGELVQRCCSVLTVEQLVQLAGQIGRERLQQQQRRQREMLAQLRKSGDELSERASDADDEPPGEQGMADEGPGAEDDVPYTLGSDPAGSIRLNAELPVDLERWQGLIAPAIEAASTESAFTEPVSTETPAQDGEFQAEALLERLLESPAPGRLVAPWDSPSLPTDPQALQVWLEGFERALVRRLRNLSHALNVELLRSGFSRSLLPPSLLQAALQGQLEPQPAPANLLRLQLPLAPDSGGDFDSVALLLRLSDLELDQPRLRSCRSRWQRHRQEIRRMAERTRRLRRQLQRLEAERLWHQDNPSPQPPPDPSPPSTRAG